VQIAIRSVALATAVVNAAARGMQEMETTVVAVRTPEVGVPKHATADAHLRPRQLVLDAQIYSMKISGVTTQTGAPLTLQTYYRQK